MPHLDAQADFARARRQGQLARLGGWLLRVPDDVGVILPYEEVVRELGFASERELGREVVSLDTIVGTVDRTRDFDRSFRPTSPRTRGRWEGIATAMRRGQAMPPISLYRIGEIHFVRDGHHRVSVSRALGRTDIDANVTEVQTRVGAERAIELADLPQKGHERLFWERVPLPAPARAEITVTDPWQYAVLAEGVEAWGFRAMQDREELLDRETVARMWLEEEYRPVVALLREFGLTTGSGTDTDVYIHVAAERYRLLRTRAWSDEVLERLRLQR
jgi:hypothetical protein